MENDLASFVRFHRKRSSLSQKQLADLAGVGKTAVFDLEKGKKSLQWDTVTRILSALNIQLRFESPLMPSFQEKSK